jgi:hypothetical protein
MRLIVVSIVIAFLSGCGSMQSEMIDYVEPLKGPTAEIKANGVLKGIGLNKTHLEIFTGCFEGRDYSKGNVLGEVYFEEKEFNSKTIKIPAGEVLYFKYGTDNYSWNCHAQFSFVPQEGKTYLFDYSMKFAGCNISVMDKTATESLPVRVQWYKQTELELFTGTTALDWRKCSNLEK